jgi:hypothetical protein
VVVTVEPDGAPVTVTEVVFSKSTAAVYGVLVKILSGVTPPH